MEIWEKEGDNRGRKKEEKLVSDSVSSLARHLRTATEVEQPSLVT